MIDYIYDGTFDGLLTVIYHHYYTDRAAGIFTKGTYQPSFLYGSMDVETDPEKADRVYQAIRNKISEHDLRGVYRAWLSCDPEKEMKILRYVVLGFRQGHRTSSLHGNPVVADMESILKKVGHESERMLQFVRFSVMEMPATDAPAANTTAGNANAPAAEGSLPGPEHDSPPTTPPLLSTATGNPAAPAANTTAGNPDAPAANTTAGNASAPAAGASTTTVLYARIEPDNDVIELAGKHFSERFPSERLIIHDIGRNKALIAWHGRWIISAFAPEDVPRPSAEEMQYRRLWKQYFDHIAIMERKNTRCQNNFIPDRYRKHLTEIITADA